jgi:hypothetical protein
MLVDLIWLYLCICLPSRLISVYRLSLCFVHHSGAQRENSVDQVPLLRQVLLYRITADTHRITADMHRMTADIFWNLLYGVAYGYCIHVNIWSQAGSDSYIRKGPLSSKWKTTLLPLITYILNA